MDKERKQDIGLMRYGAISPAVTGLPDEYRSLSDYFRKRSAQGIRHPDGEIRHYSEKTLAKWYDLYQKHGFEGLLPAGRSDAGTSRRLDRELKERIRFLKTNFPRLPAASIHRQLAEEGLIQKNELSLSTISRYLKHLDTEKGLPENDMHRYERPHINEAWYGDSSTGPYLMTEDQKKHRVYIIALIDDASRMIVGADAFFEDNFINLMAVLKSAVAKYGCPGLLSFDNGSNYRCKQMKLLAARIGTTLHFCRPYAPVQKAKIERWFRTLKDQWMAALDYKEFRSLDELRGSLHEYVRRYNQTVHSSLEGKCPEDRFFSEPEKIRRLPEEKIGNCFLLELTRRVSPDCVIVIDHTEYEVGREFAGQKICIRYSPDKKNIYVLDENETLVPVRVLNKKENADIKRQKLHLTGGES